MQQKFAIFWIYAKKAVILQAKSENVNSQIVKLYVSTCSK